jgi:hypothetical protein
MPSRQIRRDGMIRTTLRSWLPRLIPDAEEAAAPQQVINLDALHASPWVGLHYRHEFLLHYQHERLVQHLRVNWS